MEYLDLNQLKIKTSDMVYTPNCAITIIDADLDMPLSQFRAKLIDRLQPLFEQMEEHQGLPTIFDIKLNCEDIPYDDMEFLTDDFTSFSQQITSVIFECLVDMNTPREREPRLDVPSDLKEQVYMALHWLKNAINYQTKIDKFNIIIRGYFQNNTYLEFYLVNRNALPEPSISMEGVGTCAY